MALSYVGYASAAATSVSLPAFTVGDLAIVYAFRDGSTTAPSLATGWADKASSGAFTCSSRVGYRVLESGDTSTGVWANATEVSVIILRGQDTTSPFGANLIANGTNNSNTIGIDGPLTLTVTDGSSWVLGLAGHRTATDVLSRTISGMTTRSSGGSATALGAWTEQVSSWPSEKTATVNATSGWRSYTLEILAASGSKQTSTAEVSLAAGQVPATRTDHQFVVRARITNAAHTGVLRVQLYEGATARGAVLETSALTTTLATYSVGLPDADAAAIVSYANLSARVQGFSSTGTATVFEVASLGLELPQSTTGQGYGAMLLASTSTVAFAGDVVSSGDKATAAFEVSLGAGSVPTTRTAHSIAIRARKLNAAHTATIRAQLFEGTTARSTEIESGALTTSLAAYTLNIADADAATITDYSNLSVRVRGYASTGDAAQFEVASLSLALPAVGGTTSTGAMVLSALSSVSVGGAIGGPIYPGAAVYPHGLVTFSAVSAVTPTPGLDVAGASRIASVSAIMVGGASPPTSITGLVTIASVSAVSVGGSAAGDRVGQSLIASIAYVEVEGFQDAAADISFDAVSTVSIRGSVLQASAPPGFTSGLDSMPDLQIAVAFDSKPLETIQNYEPVTDFSRVADTKRGRQFELDRFEAATAHLLLDNRDGRFNPENPASPYYPNIKPTRRVRIATAWDLVIYDLFNGFLEGYPQEYPHRGYDRVVTQNAVDLFMALAVSKLIPATTQLTSNMGAITGETTQTITVGNAALPMPQAPPFNITIDAETMTVTAVSGQTYTVARSLQGSSAHGVGATVTTDNVSFGQEYTGQRIRNVLDHVNLSLPVSLDTGRSLLAPSDNLAGQPPIEHIQLVADAEQGRFFAAKNGVLTFHDRHHFYALEKNPRAVFGDDAGSSEIPYADVKVTHEDQKLYNIIRITAANGTTHEARDQASIDDHFERVLAKEWPLADANEARDAADFLLSRLSRMQVRIPELTVRPAIDADTIYPVVLGMEIGQRFDFKLRPKDGSAMIDKSLVVEGVSHAFNAQDFTTQVQLSLADPTHYWQIEVAGFSELDDTTTLIY